MSVFNCELGGMADGVERIGKSSEIVVTLVLVSKNSVVWWGMEIMVAAVVVSEGTSGTRTSETGGQIFAESNFCPKSFCIFPQNVIYLPKFLMTFF